MHIGTLAKKSILILGYGKEGQSMAQAIKTYAPDCNITIGDANAAVTIAPEAFALQAGKDWLTNLDTFEVIIKSPGIPPLSELLPYAGKCTSPTRIFLDSIASSGANVIGVTGSKGKSTTSSLIHAILKAAGKETLLVCSDRARGFSRQSHAKHDRESRVPDL